jgi:hypothetical protein
LDKIEDAIAEIRAGKLIIVVDDEDRENEGDFLTAAHNVTPEIINFMATHGRGLICAPLTNKRCEELELQMMVTNPNNTAVLRNAVYDFRRPAGQRLHDRHLRIGPLEDDPGPDRSRHPPGRSGATGTYLSPARPGRRRSAPGRPHGSDSGSRATRGL